MPGVVALVAYAVSGCPCGCAWLVRLRGFPCTLARGVVHLSCVCACLCAPGFSNGVWRCVRVVRLVFWWGVLLRALWRVCSIVCLSVAPCSIACCWFVAVCFVCRLLHGVRFVSAPAPTVTWFMQVCAGVHLTATVVVIYRLPCNGRFWQFAARFCVPGVSR